MLLLPLILLPILNIISIWYKLLNHSQVLLLSISNFLHALFLIYLYDTTTSGFQFKLIISDRLIAGIDGISLWLILLTNIIICVVMLNGQKKAGPKKAGPKKAGPKKADDVFTTLILLIQMLSILVFIVLDILLFYISFEAILLPMYFLVGYYGSRDKKIEANNYLFLYTILGSLLLLLSIIVVILNAGTSDYEVLLTMPIEKEQQLILWLGFYIALAIKMPMFPFHIWLPMAHTEAPTEGSVILAAILLKLGTYGFLRYSIPLFPYATAYFGPFVIMMAIIGVLYSCLAALSLIDLKQIIAYSSIGHMNVSIIGLFSNDLNGLTGSYLYTIGHGFVSAGLFLLVGFLYNRYHTRTLKYYRGLVLILPMYVLLLFLFVLTNLSFPGSIGFIAEMLIYFSSLTLSPLVLLLVSLASILLPIYIIWTFQRISFGTLSPYISTIYTDITIKEFSILLPLLVLTIYFGIFPTLLFSTIELPLAAIIY